jgi:hypothetical protein
MQLKYVIHETFTHALSGNEFMPCTGRRVGPHLRVPRHGGIGRRGAAVGRLFRCVVPDPCHKLNFKVNKDHQERSRNLSALMGWWPVQTQFGAYFRVELDTAI